MKFLPVMAISAAVIAVSAQAQTQDKSTAGQPQGGAAAPALKGPVVAVDTLTMKGKVTSINPALRHVVVQGSDGSTATMVAGPDVRNFDNLKVGDEVTMRYTQAHSLAIAKGTGDASKIGEIRTKVEAQAARQAPAGGKPGVTAMERTTLVANVFDIDRQAGTITLRGTSGVPVKIKVPDKQALQDIRKDDQVVIAYREAMAVSIQPGDQSVTPSTAPPTAAGKSR